MASSGLRFSEPTCAKRAGNADWTQMSIPTLVLPPPARAQHSGR